MTAPVTSRRAFLAASGTAIAGLTPAVAIASLAPADAELLALGREFDGLHAGYLPANEMAKAHAKEMRRGVDAMGRSLSAQEYQALADASGFSASSKSVEAVAATLDGITAKIRRLPATTPAGFHVKMRAASYDCGFSAQIGALSPGKAGLTPDDMDFDVRCFFDLLADAERFAAHAAG